MRPSPIPLFLALALLAAPALGEPFPWQTPVYPRGPWEGKPIDDSKARPVVILTPEQAAPYRPAPGELVVANFSHKGEFYIAKIPADAVERVVLQNIKFKSYKELVQHMQLRFILAEGKEVQLFDQSDMSRTEPVERIREIQYSSEAVADQQKFATDPERQLNGKVVLIRRILSPVDNYATLVAPAKNPLVQIPLDSLSTTEANELLRDAITRSHGDGYNRLYNWFYTTCVTDCWGLLQNARDTDWLRSWLARRLKPFPFFMKAQLWLRGFRPPGGFAEMPEYRKERPELERDPWVRGQIRQALAETKADRNARRAALHEQQKESRAARLLRTAAKVPTVCTHIFNHLSFKIH